jgi:hypothetical protein
MPDTSEENATIEVKVDTAKLFEDVTNMLKESGYNSGLLTPESALNFLKEQGYLVEHWTPEWIKFEILEEFNDWKGTHPEFGQDAPTPEQIITITEYCQPCCDDHTGLDRDTVYEVTREFFDDLLAQQLMEPENADLPS